jgi:hypothetical protein
MQDALERQTDTPPQHRPSHPWPDARRWSSRIADAFRHRLDTVRYRDEAMGRDTSTSAAAEPWLHPAHERRRAIAALLGSPTASLLDMRRKVETGMVLSRAEWAVLAQFVSTATDTWQLPEGHVSAASFVAVLDAFLAVYTLRRTYESRLDPDFLANLPDECRPTSTDGAGRASCDLVRQAVLETRRQVIDPAIQIQPVRSGRNLALLLAEERLWGTQMLDRALRPFWSALWRLAARGHFSVTQKPIRERTTPPRLDQLPPMVSVAEGPFSLSFLPNEHGEVAALLNLPAPRGAAYPMGSFQRFWNGDYFLAFRTAVSADEATVILFRAHDNGIQFSFSSDEWAAIDRLFRKAWTNPEIARNWEALTSAYGAA